MLQFKHWFKRIPREVSSVGLERLLHTPEVEGSNPLLPTLIDIHSVAIPSGCFFWLCVDSVGRRIFGDGFSTRQLPGLPAVGSRLSTW